MSGHGLDFSEITPAASTGLGGLIRDHFSNGRLFATVGWHGGFINISYWGNQHLGASGFFQVGLESAWLKMFPRIDVGSPVLNSAFGQYPEIIEYIKLPDRSGAVRATQAGYFVWGWDGMTPLLSSTFCNEPDYAAAILRFYQSIWDPAVGIGHQLQTNFSPNMRGPAAAQAQYIAGLYHYIATTGELSLAAELLPTCNGILGLCQELLVGETGLVAGNALWPDFPEAMEEDGRDISSMNNSILYQGLRSMEYLYSRLGNSDAAIECANWARTLRANFIRYLFDSEHGFFITSCSSTDFAPRKHYGCQTVLWLTPFARELVSHATGRISSFMDSHLRSAKCLLSLPPWDTAWMADGNQLGSSFPIADLFYLNVHKLLGDESGLNAWLGDVEWFWRFHTAPEAFTPEAENEDEFGPDNHGCKQMQALTSWYSSVYSGIAGIDCDHEGITLTPWGDRPVSIQGLILRGIKIDLFISGKGAHIGELKLDGQALPPGCRKLAWSTFEHGTAKLELQRSVHPPLHPVIVRADGLCVKNAETNPGRLFAIVDGMMSGEVIVQVRPDATVKVDNISINTVRDPDTGTVCIRYLPDKPISIEIVESRS